MAVQRELYCIVKYYVFTHKKEMAVQKNVKHNRRQSDMSQCILVLKGRWPSEELTIKEKSCCNLSTNRGMNWQTVCSVSPTAVHIGSLKRSNLSGKWHQIASLSLTSPLPGPMQSYSCHRRQNIKRCRLLKLIQSAENYFLFILLLSQ